MLFDEAEWLGRGSVDAARTVDHVKPGDVTGIAPEDMVRRRQPSRSGAADAVHPAREPDQPHARRRGKRPRNRDEDVQEDVCRIRELHGR
jgi:hypothetical protein